MIDEEGKEVLPFLELDSLSTASSKTAKQKVIIDECKNRFRDFLKQIEEKNIEIEQKKIDRVLSMTKAKIKALLSPNEIYEAYQNFLYLSLSRKNLKKRNWNQIEIEIFLWVVIFYCEKIGIEASQLSCHDWISISMFFPNYNGEKCQFKWMSLQKSQVQIFQWSPEEDLLLRFFIEKYEKPKWTAISLALNQQMGSQSMRSPRQCRERWFNYLNPSLKKGLWKPKEDIHLLEKVLEFGRKWSQISKDIPGRNENSVKNRFFSLLKISPKNINEEQINLKLYMKIKELKDMFKEKEAPKLIRPVPLTPNHCYGMKVKNDVSLSNLSISNASFALVKKAHKKKKSKAQMTPDLNRFIRVENSPMPAEEKYENSLQPATSSIHFESLDCLRDDLESHRDKKVENLGNLNDSNRNHSNNITQSSHNEFKEVLSGVFSKVMDAENERIPALTQISSISSFQNPDSKHSWITNVLKLELSPRTKDLSSNRFNFSNDSPKSRLGLEFQHINRIKNNLIEMSLDQSNHILHLSHNSGENVQQTKIWQN